MATETPNLKLKKPGEADFYSIADFNDNWDKLDAMSQAVAAAGAYDSTAAYALGAYCTQGGKLWKCTTAIPAGEAWNEAHWAEITLAELLEGKQNALTFDAAPTAGSTNPVTSGGVAAGLAGKAGYGAQFTGDLNELQQFGSYRLRGNCTNLPNTTDGSLQYTHVFVFGTPAATATQLIMSYGKDTIFMRAYQSVNGWSAWVQLAKAPIKLTATVPTASWTLSGTCYQQTVAVSGLLATDDLQNAEIVPVGNKTDAAAQMLTDAAYALMAGPGGLAWCNANGQMFLRCPPGAAKPAVNFSIAIAVVR